MWPDVTPPELLEEVWQAEVLTSERLTIIIPDCCKEGWEDCPHVVQRPKPKRGNIAL